MKMLLDGQETAASTGAVTEVLNPATGEVLDNVPRATEADVQRCLMAAQAAAKGWAEVPVRGRAAILQKGAARVEAGREALATLLCKETGRLYGQCLYEVDSTIRLLQDFSEYAKHLTGHSYQDMDAPGLTGSFAFTVREPLGVVVCIAPFNYPIETLTFKLAPALLMGNAVIVKPPSDTPLTILRYCALLLEAGVPGGTLQVVTGSGAQLGKWLVETPLVNAVSFTGSTGVGCEIAAMAAPYLHRLVLELGGNDAVLVFEDADVDYVVGESLIRLWNAGQTCCGTKRYLVHNSIRAQFVKKLAAILSGVTVGDPFDPATGMGSLVSEAAAVAAEKQVLDAVAQGAVLVCGGQRQGAFLTPAILDNVTADMDVAVDEECFSPVFTVIGFDTEEEAVSIANASCYGLNAGVVSADMNRSVRVAMQLQAGTVVTNSVSQWRTNEAPFGGYKKSGIGKENLACSIEEMSQQKTVVIKGIH